MLSARRALHDPLVGGPFLESFSTGTATNGLMVINKPSGVVAGSFLVAVVYWADTNATQIAPPAGWTNTDSLFNGSASGNGAMYYLLAGGSEPATYEFDCAAFPSTGIILNYTGASGIDAHDANFSNVGTTAASVGSLTPAGANRTLIAAFCSFNGYSFTDPSGMTLEVNAAESGTAASIYVFDKRGIGSATGTINSTQSSSGGYQSFDVLLHA